MWCILRRVHVSQLGHLTEVHFCLKLLMGHGAVQNGFDFALTSQASSRKENQSEVKGIGLRKQNVRVVFLEPLTH